MSGPGLELDACRRAVAANPGSAAAQTALGKALLGAGERAEAVACFEQAVALQPEDAEAWYQLGYTLSLLGRLDEARDRCLKAIALAPDHAEAHTNIGYTLFSAGRWEEALGYFSRAVALKPEYTRAHFNRGLCLLNLHRPGEAVECFHRALALQPEFTDAHYQLAQARAALQQWDEAAASLQEVVRLQPDHVQALYQLGKIGGLQGNYHAAAAFLRRVIALSPGYAPAHRDLGLACMSLGAPEEALSCYQAALARAPDDAETWCYYGRACLDLGRPEEAIASFERALALKPDDANACVGLGNALLYQSRPGQAIAQFQRALDLKAEPAPVYANLGIAHQHLGRMDEALTYYLRAQAHDETNVEAHWNEGLCRLTLGDLRAGFEQAEWRWKQAEFAPLRAVFPEPPWLGQEDLRGKTILLWSEQGLGDVLQFCRYVPMVAARGATVVLGIPSELTRLLARLPGAARVIGTGAARPGYDYHCPLMSLPLAFGTTLETIPAAVPYLQADTAQIAAWRDRLGPARGRRIGLAWSGNPAHKNDRNRSIALAEFAPVLGTEAEFISVQKEARESDRATLAAHAGLRHYGEWLKDMDDTAALLSCLDLVITVDTAVAHLAGALGKPVWILLPYTPDWRWLLERDDSPWYPTARLFRQPAIGDWTAVLQRVAAELQP